ncbi:MAG TPA: AAA-like domain-containing protein [Candidatus Solibacter sp.]|nr:AAA-like domain-containing protein [Candidatus Solibacter sp.]
MSQTGSVTVALEMAHVLCLDIVAGAVSADGERTRIIEELEREVRATNEFARAQKRDQVAIDIGDRGLAVLFFGDLEAPVRCAVELSKALRRRSAKLPLRMGAHTGAACREGNASSNRAITSGGLSVAQRLSDCGDEGHILVSGATADLLLQLGHWNASLHDLGDMEFPPGRRLRVVNFYGEEFGNSRLPKRAQAELVPVGSPLAKNAAGDPMVGRQVSHYKIIKKLGGGGMGVVYEGQDLRLGRRVALKFLPEEWGQSRNRVERFMQEARASSALNHPNICIVHDVGDFDGRYFIVMELLEGETLRHALKQRRLTNEEMIRYGQQIADALDCAHTQGIIHRDIKSANIFITTRGHVKVLDFGLAKFTLRAAYSGLNESNTPTKTTSSDLTNPGELIGTVSYMSPEQARGHELDARTDLFSFGVVLYEMATGSSPFPGDTEAVVFEALLNRAPTTPVRLNPAMPAGLEEIINKALEKDRNLRYQSAAEMSAALQQAGLAALGERKSDTVSRNKVGEIAILYKRNAQPDEQILSLLESQLRARGYQSFVDRHLQVGMEWAREIEQRVSSAYAVIVLLSGSAVSSEMLAYEVQVAHEAAQKTGRPRILPVRIDYEAALPSGLAAILDGIQYAHWKSPRDNESLVEEICESLQNPQASRTHPVKLETVGGAVPLDSKFYILRPTDEEFFDAIGRKDSIILIKGARQMGKTSLMARGLQEARKAGAKVILTDFQKLNASHLESVDKLFLALSEAIADQLDLDVIPADVWNPRRGPSMNFERFLRREILAKISAPLVWGMDEIDRLFSCNFGSEVFGLFRSWHNERSLDPAGPWQNLTLAIAYATEAHMFITDMNQSPFNVGTRLVLSDFTLEQVVELNRRYDSPLRDQTELARFYDLVAGQPYLTRRGLHELASRKLGFWDFEAQAARDEGPFGDHLRRLLVSLAQDNTLLEIMRGLLTGRPAASPEAFYRLRSAGLVSGEAAREMKLRCKLYQLYLSRHLL